MNVIASNTFEGNAVEDEDPEIADGTIDWLSLQASKRPKLMSLEDSVAKAHRLKADGATLAEAERYICMLIDDAISDIRHESVF